MRADRPTSAHPRESARCGTILLDIMRPSLLLLAALPAFAGCSCSETDDVPGGGGGGGHGDCAAIGVELADNAIDEDCDGWLDSSVGVSIRATHPRVLLTAEMLEQTVDRMVGPNAREPYSRWFDLIKQSEDEGEPVDLASLALIFHATGEASYRDRFVERVPTEGDPDFVELLGIDMMFDHLPDATKLTVMDRVAANPDVWYWNAIAESQSDDASWGYHAAYGVSRGLAYAGIFALTPLELDKDPAVHPFDTLNYLRLVEEELSEQGNFWRIENRVAGDPTYNDALPGDFGGMYDNIGYDSSEESFSVNLIAQWLMLTGRDRTAGFLHDQYRARFYQNLSYPHLYSAYDQDQWCRAAGTESHIIARIWNTQTDWISQPRTDAVALTSWLYGDPRMQHYQHQGVRRELCGAPYDGMFWDLIFYDDGLEEQSSAADPTAMYFNGPGLAAMRGSWDNDAAFAVLMAGEGISRRYEDAGSFLLHRKTDVFPHAGARIRNNTDNDKHHWFHIRSASKNTIKVFDPDECLDLDASSNRGPLHSGPPLVPSDNLGGQMFETGIAEQDGQFDTWLPGQPQRTSDPNHPLGLYETANITKFEHVEGAYSYAVADGAAAYTRKIDYFERELLFLRPSTFVIFDRVAAADPSFKKAWVVHTVDPPSTSCTPSEQGLGMRAWTDCAELDITNPANATYIDTLLPEQNRVVVRGGDTVLARAPLGSGSPISAAQILDSDIPRWLELFAVGDDVEGSVTLSGDAEEGAGSVETIGFDADTRQTYVSSAPSADVSAGELHDSTRSWTVDQWAGYMVHISCGGDSEEVVISGNDEDTLFGVFTPCSSAWGYQIFRPLANSYLHWQHIDSITTSDMEVASFTVSVPHYFDTEDASGRLHTFAPHTDGRDDGYQKRRDYGQHTLSIEATVPSLHDNFLNVLTLVDPGIGRPNVQLIRGSNVEGAVVDGRIVIFASMPGALSSLAIDLPAAAGFEVLVADLEPNTTYSYSMQATTLQVDSGPSGGQQAQSSAMGVLALDL